MSSARTRDLPVIEGLQREIEALRDQLAQVQSERDYLRWQVDRFMESIGHAWKVTPNAYPYDTASISGTSPLWMRAEEGMPLGYEHTHAAARMWAERGRPL